METVLEQQRRYHEERERLIDSLTKEMLFVPKTHKEKVNSEHRQRYLYDRYLELTQELIDLYEDKYGIAKQDIAAISGPNEFNEFYLRLKNIKDFHKQHPGEINVPLSVEFEKFKDLRENPEEAGATIVQFSSEEGYGRFIDLHELYDQYINLKEIPKVDYLSYLGCYDRLFDLPRDRKTSYYKDYLDNLIGYLENFISRSMPMTDLRQEIRKAIEDFEEQWKSGQVRGWNKDAAPALSNSGAHLDLTAFTNAEELASLGLDRLKSALMALGLKCGGTLEERAKRLWATKGIQIEDIPKEFFAQKNGKEKILNPKLKKEDLSERQKEIAQLEVITYSLANLVSDQRDATIENIQRKQARGPAERDEDDSDAEEINNENEGEGAEDDENDDVPYNPKNLPLGWDGKPIPYWLYKLHGLNMYYSCEICGNQTYRGPKAFQRHFSEWRHAHGMRCLGIPNTAHFAHITKIEDALALWQTIRVNKESERWKADQEEEMEDAVGNVVSKKIYDDLKRQGLI